MTTFMAKKSYQPPPLEPKEFRSVDEIDRAIEKLERRVRELEELDVPKAVLKDTGPTTSRGATCGRRVWRCSGRTPLSLGSMSTSESGQAQLT
jgi:hypothetical protein